MDRPDGTSSLGAVEAVAPAILLLLRRSRRRVESNVNPQKRKGDQAERELATLLADHLGITIRRKLGAGRQDDTGDLAGIPNTIAQVANWTDALRAIREKPEAADRQRGNAAATYAVTFIRLRGGLWRAVLTIDQWATYARETLETHD